MRRPHPGLLLVLVVLVVSTSMELATPQLVQANPYQVAVCSDLVTNQPAPSDDWTPATSGASYEGASGCSSGGVMTAWLTGQHNYGDTAAMTFSSPAGTTIDAFSLWRSMYSGGYQPYGAPVTSISYDQTLVDVNSQAYGSLEPEGSATQQSLVGAHGLDAHTITISAGCGGGPGGVCPAGNPTAQINIYGGDIELNDAVAPTVSGLSGSLTQGGTLSGQQTIIFTVADQGSGVYNAALLIDGRPVTSRIVNTNGGRCIPMRTAPDGALVFAYVVPCPTSTSGTLTVNTGQISGGPHQAELVVSDAAGNATATWSAAISVNNPPTSLRAPTIQDTTRPRQSPHVGDMLSVSAGQWSPQPSTMAYRWQSCAANGSRCLAIPSGTAQTHRLQASDVGRRLLAQVTATTAQGSAIMQTAYTPPVLVASRTRGPGAANGKGACRTATLVVHFHKRAKATVRFGQVTILRGRLSCRGKAIRNATIVIRAGATARVITDASGRFAYRPSAGPSRTLRLSYTAFAHDRRPDASASARLNVIALITLTITPRTLGNGQPITLSGQVEGGPYPAKGIALNVQYRASGHWHTFDQTSARGGASGATYTYVYRFQHTERPTSFSLRVALPATGSAGYSYSAGASRRVTVHVS